MVTFRLVVTHGETGQWTITSPELSELHVIGWTFNEALQTIPVAVDGLKKSITETPNTPNGRILALL